MTRALEAPRANVAAHWPALSEALLREGVGDAPCAIAALATVATDTPAFEPVAQPGPPAAFARDEPPSEQARLLGNTRPGDGFRFRGRGFVPLTGRRGYGHLGRVLDLPLVERPELALEPAHATAILVAFLQERDVFVLARAGDWRGVRAAVSPSLQGWERFRRHVARLERAYAHARADRRQPAA